MSVFVDVMAIILTSLICFAAAKRILTGKTNILFYCVASFYVVQVVPMILNLVLGVAEDLSLYPMLYTAMTDVVTGYWYAQFVVFCEAALYWFGLRFPTREWSIEDPELSFINIRKARVIKFVLYLGMFSPVIAALFAPDPSRYLVFSYYYMNPSVPVDPYHTSIISYSNLLACFCMLLIYLNKGTKEQQLDIYATIALITWISGKRTLLIIALLGILAVDVVFARYKGKLPQFFLKAAVFAGIALWYFLLYSDLTGKGSSHSFMLQYSIYFGRMSNVKTAIYDALNGNTILDYPGQTILFDLLFWIPRTFWPDKPVIYAKYFTAFVIQSPTIALNWQLQVNIWTEFISNFSLLGPIIAVLVLAGIAWVSAASKNFIIYLLGLALALFYTLFGMEAFVQLIFAAWIGMLVLNFVYQRNKEKILKFIRRVLAALGSRGFFRWMPDRPYLELMYYAKIGQKLALDPPVAFNAKLQWLKLNDRNPRYVDLVDKYEVKEFVAQVIGREHIIPTLGVWDTFEEIDFDALPNRFVLKCTHDSGGLAICRDKATFDRAAAKKKIDQSLKTNYYYHGREWPYKNVKPRIIAEQYMEENTSGELKDYKFMVFGGEVRCSFVCADRGTAKGLHMTFFDREWDQMPFARHYPIIENLVPKPACYEQMLELAEKLAEGIPFVRVDFYEINGNVYFGEMTFYPGSGFEEFTPEEWDDTLGSWLTLPEKN